MSDFGRLIEQEVPRLRRYARALTRDVGQADDLVQSCLVRALAKEHLWQPGSNLRAWISTASAAWYASRTTRSSPAGALHLHSPSRARASISSMSSERSGNCRNSSAG